ncbi:MAG: DNA-3-methyladenine glycosylase [Candidatus Paceibacterota bacterium]
MRKQLSHTFYARDAEKVARELLGKYLCIQNANGSTKRYVIWETEGYVGPQDKASQAYGGRKTPRNEVMFGKAGYWYVYFTYGMHHMVNIITDKEGYPSAVLLRGVGEWDGPGKLTRALGIDKDYNKKPATKKSGMWIEESGIIVPKKEIKKTPRIGIPRAEEWVEKPLRFVWEEFKQGK